MRRRYLWPLYFEFHRWASRLKVYTMRQQAERMEAEDRMRRLGRGRG